jgi:hypothetical protein
MKVWKRLGATVVAPLLFLMVATPAQGMFGGTSGPAFSSDNPVHVELTGYVRLGQFRDPDTRKSVPYLYLELKEPIGKYVNNLKPSEEKYRDIELVGGSSSIIYRLEDLVGKKITVRGKLPFHFDANAPRVVLPLVMVMDASNPQLFK